MEGLVQILSEWEIQFLVLLSFTLQVFLFFTGGLRRRSTNSLLRISMWVAYLGADLVAIYALGFLSRHHEDVTTGKKTFREAHPLAFLWAPFLLVHLGGQDTMTAFAIEDNKLWLRHLLNLVVQVVVALYVFWVSMTGHDHLSVQLPGIFVFIAGVIKYGERTLALMYGNLKSISSKSTSIGNVTHGYLGIVATALKTAPGIRELFAGRTLHQMKLEYREALTSNIHVNHLPKLLEIELALMYADIYTKDVVLRTRSGILFRCVSQVSLMVAFMLFIVGVANNQHGYSRADLAITYVLFTGGLFLEVCAVFIWLKLPWTWAWLETRNCCGLARISSFLLSSNIGRPERRVLWSNSMGQYSLLSFVSSDHRSRLSKLVKNLVAASLLVVCAGKEVKLSSSLWTSKLLDSEYTEVDKEIMDSVIRMVNRCQPGKSIIRHEDLQNLGALLPKLVPDLGASFGYGIVCFHVFTEVYLRDYAYPDRDLVLVNACRKLSNYMLYLLVTHSEMLPISGTTDATLVFFLDKLRQHDGYYNHTGAILRAKSMLKELNLPELDNTSAKALEEMRELWTRLLIYSAGKSRAEMHAAQLSSGGELLTFTWLLMAHKELGDVGEAFNFNLGDGGRYPRITTTTLGRAAVPGARLVLEYATLALDGLYQGAPGQESQDAHLVATRFAGDPNLHLFAVFDGHGAYGAACAEFAREALPRLLLLLPQRAAGLSADPARAFREALVAANEEMHAAGGIDDSMSGTTAVAALVAGGSLHVANVGDSRAVAGVWRDGRIAAEELSWDQTPFRVDERARVKACGARVMSLEQVEGVRNPDAEGWLADEGGPPRVWARDGLYPGTAFTRSLGDLAAEGFGVIAEPEVKSVEITPAHLFFVVASDGVFEFLSSQEVVDMVAMHKDPRDACSAIAAESYKLWLEHENRTDDITIIIVHIRDAENLIH